jgi:glycosyltransferase involved in cell wall biosynthesis
MNAADPRVSVIVPTYNREAFIGIALESVVDQTFPDFEILVVDDGSTDGTEQILEQIQDQRIIYLRQEHSGLPAVARNTGLRHARGEYIAFLDSDDLWTADKLAVQVAYMDSHPEIGLSYANSYQFVEDPGRCLSELILHPGEGLSGRVFDRLYGNQRIPNLTVMIQASVVDTVGLFDEDEHLKANEDYEYWLRIAEKYPIGYIDQPLAKYRQHLGGISKATIATCRAKLALIEKLDVLYSDFVARHPDRRAEWISRIHYRLGRAYLHKGQIREARQHLRFCCLNRPRQEALVFLLASCAGKTLYLSLAGLWAWMSARSTRRNSVTTSAMDAGDIPVGTSRFSKRRLQ